MTSPAQSTGGPLRLFPTHRHLMRLTLEAVTPLSIAGGRPDPLLDTSLIRDANGLPTIPGTSVAGVLRRLHEDYFGEDATQALFGIEHGGSTEGRASALEVSFGCLQDSNGQAVEGLLIGKAGSERLADPILSAALAAAPLKRDHVALDARGTAIEHFKFERSSLPPGYRFSLELALWSGVDAQEDVEAPAAAEAAKQARSTLARVLALFGVPYFRLGGATRRGLGRLLVVGAAQYVAFDMRRAEDRRRHADARARGLHETPRTDGFADFVPAALPAEGGMRQPVTATISLRPRGVWRFGRGEHWPSFEGRDVDDAPLAEARVVWINGKARLRPGIDPTAAPGVGRNVHATVPASAVKGALAHRAEFHWRRLTGAWAGTEADVDDRLTDVLFGAARSDGGGHAGHLVVDDASIDFDLGKETCVLSHNSLDRFTQGVRNQVLFNEAVLEAGEIRLKLTALRRDGEGSPVDVRAWRAFGLALADLCSGRLALGADSHGWCDGRIEWSDPEWAAEAVLPVDGTA